MKYLIILIGFAFTVSFVDTCGGGGSDRVFIKGPYSTIEQCKNGISNYKELQRNTVSECWEIP